MTALHPFSARHIGPGLADTRAMLAAIGAPSMETLISQAVPKSIRLDRPLDLPAPAYHHHRMILDSGGRKLSKSTAATGLRELRAQGASAQDIRRMVGLAE